MIKYKLSQYHIDNILNNLVLPSSIENVNDSYYFGDYGSWTYKTEYTDSKILFLNTPDYEYNIHITNTERKQKILIVIAESGSDVFSETDDDNDLVSSCKFYNSEEEHFMDSTVKNLSIPYNVMYELDKFIEDLWKMI